MGISIVILAAGEGKRMNSTLPKVLQPLAGRPLLQHVIGIARATGADDICIVYGHGGDQVRAALADADVRWALQAEQHGTGHAVMQAMPETPDDNLVVVMYGDVPLLHPGTIARMCETAGPDGVAVLTVNMDKPFGYGRILRENGYVVRSIEEKDATKEEKAITEVNTGVTCAPAKKLKQWLANLKNDNAQGEYYLTDVLEMAAQGRDFGPWCAGGQPGGDHGHQRQKATRRGGAGLPAPPGG